MPELPEVETIKRGLGKKIIGLKIKKLEVIYPKLFIGNPNLVLGKKVLNINRIAKLLGMELSGGLTLFFHLKMTGQLIWVDSSKTNTQTRDRFIGGHPTHDMREEMPNKSTRVIFSFSDGSKLYFNDQRKFGWLRLIQTEQLNQQKFLINLGPEPLGKDFTWQLLKRNLLKHKSQAVKVAIIDQSVVSGVGNIYASEACFNASLDPRLKITQLSDDQIKHLHWGILKSLKEGIMHGGSSKTHFVNEEGKKGYFLDYANVYWREGEPCKICGGLIKKIKLGGRGTYFCENCQK